MKKTKIEFKDIKPGDMLIGVNIENGVKTETTGVAFEFKKLTYSGYSAWQTSEGGLLMVDGDGDTIYRVDVFGEGEDD